MEFLIHDIEGLSTIYTFLRKFKDEKLAKDFLLSRKQVENMLENIHDLETALMLISW